MLDIYKPKHIVQIEIDKNGQILWVNVDDECQLRICNISVPIVITDNRSDEPHDEIGRRNGLKIRCPIWASWFKSRCGHKKELINGNC